MHRFVLQDSSDCGRGDWRLVRGGHCGVGRGRVSEKEKHQKETSTQAFPGDGGKTERH